MRQTVLLSSLVVLSLSLLWAGPLGSATVATASVDATLQTGPGMLILLGAGLLGVNRWWR